MDISIIVPVYNVEKYLERCLDSIFDQKFLGSFEVIAVNDCSTDNSLGVLKAYQLRFPELIIREHKINKKLAQARTTGMIVAKGDYIMHVDSDDWLLPNALETIYNKCIETNVDVLVYNYLIENEKGEQTVVNDFTKEIITTDKLKVQKYFSGACWTKIVKKSLTENMVYSQTEAPRSTEDLIYCSEILLRAKTICLFPHKFYGYFKNSKSITQSTKPLEYLSNQIIIATNLYEICKRYKTSDDFRKRLIDYFDKWLFLAIAKTQYYNKELLPECEILLKEINAIGLLDESRVRKIKKATNNKYYTLVQIVRRFNLRLAAGIVFRSLKGKVLF
jgi:glycosyltransferase involved in cell wall biosynthesis|tara:strand:+ start:534 stop:1532 length:999 start_codon:yes stop_codon:yes gene_type:complete